MHCVPMFVWERDRPDLVCWCVSVCVYVFVCDFPDSQPCSTYREQTEQIPWQTYYSLNRSLARALESKTITLFLFYVSHNL